MRKLFTISLVALFALPVMSKTYNGTDSEGDACWLKLLNVKYEQFGGARRMVAKVIVSYTNTNLPAFSKVTFDENDLKPVVDKSLLLASYGNEGRMRSAVIKLNDSDEPLQFRYVDRKYSIFRGEVIKKDVLCTF